MIYSWFLYPGLFSPLDPFCYEIVSHMPRCSQGNVLCAIYAPVQLIGGSPLPRPYIGEELSAEIFSALEFAIPYPNVRLKISALKLSAAVNHSAPYPSTYETGRWIYTSFFQPALMLF